MTDSEIINEIKRGLRDWAFKDIKKTSAGKAKMGAFILASCYIDQLACFCFNAEGRYKDFVQTWLPKYDPTDLYKSLRCRLVHNYTEGGKYFFTSGHREAHLKQGTNGKTIINLEDFIAELEDAQEKYFKAIDAPTEYRQNAIKRYKKVGILCPGKTDIHLPNGTVSNVSKSGSEARI